jgi:hypothetical protein
MTDEPGLFEWRMSAPRSRAEQIFKAFKMFHEKNPVVWELFQKFALEASLRFDHYSANAIFERIRWHIDIETGGEVKLNNNFRPYYARMFHVANPTLASFFMNRKLTSCDSNSSPTNKQVFDSGEPEAEEWLESNLRDLIGSAVA